MSKFKPLPCLFLGEKDIEEAILEKVGQDTNLASLEVKIWVIDGNVCAIVTTTNNGGESLVLPYAKEINHD